MTVKIEKSWQVLLNDEFEKHYFKDIIEFVHNEYTKNVVYPAPKNIFKAFDLCSFDKVKVVIIGQDPYHGPKQANGLCFSVSEGIKVPPSLKNIYKELKSDTGKEIPESGNLESWAEQGVLLLNATLTVRAESPGSHQKKGWETFTDSVIKIIAEKKKHCVFLLWGAYAQQKGAFIDRERHLVLEASHPSPFSADRGFFGCKHFSKTNAYLKSHKVETIDW